MHSHIMWHRFVITKKDTCAAQRYAAVHSNTRRKKRHTLYTLTNCVACRKKVHARPYFWTKNMTQNSRLVLTHRFEHVGVKL